MSSTHRRNSAKIFASPAPPLGWYGPFYLVSDGGNSPAHTAEILCLTWKALAFPQTLKFCPLFVRLR